MCGEETRVITRPSLREAGVGDVPGVNSGVVRDVV